MAIAAVPEAKLLPNLGDRLRAFATRLVPPWARRAVRPLPVAQIFAAASIQYFGHANVPLSQMIRLAV